MNINIERLSQFKVTSMIIILNVIVFLAMSFSGGSESIDTLIKFGANVRPLVASGQWFRLLTASFIHIGFLHILLNMYFIYSLGPIFEKLYGSFSFLIIYLVSGVFGNLLSYGFGNNLTVSAGASTSLYGMLGLAIGIMINYRNDDVLRNFGSSFIYVIVINLIFSILTPKVGIYGHLGGFLSGIILAGVFPVVGRDLPIGRQMISIIILLALGFFLIKLGNKSVFGV